MASSPFLTRDLALQPRTPNPPLLTNIATTTINLCTSSIRPCNLPLHATIASASASTTATNPSHEQTKASTSTATKHTKTNKNLDFDDTTINITSLSSSNTKSQMVQQIRHKHAQFPKSISVFNRLLNALIVEQEPEICLALFKKLQSFELSPDVSTYSIMIRCHCQRNDPEEATRVLHTLLENGFQPNEATVTVLISSLCKKGKVNKAKEVFNLIEKMGCCNLGIQAHNWLMKGLCYVGKVEEALEMLVEMKGSSSSSTQLLKPDVYSYTAVMDGLCKVGLSEEAMILLNEAVGVGIVPNVFTFNTLIQGYSREGRPMEGVALLKMMKERHGCDPGYVNYITVLHGLVKWNKVKEGFLVYREMAELGFEVDVGMMGKLVRRLCRLSWRGRGRGLLQDACEVFEKMKQRKGSSVVFDQGTLEVMVQALCWGNRVDEALECLNEMVRLGYAPRAITFDKVIQGLCWKGKVEEAVPTLVLWLENGGVPHRVSYEVLIEGLNAQGRLFCASNVFGAALKQGVVPKREPLLCKSYGD